jgi:hypothetical protein
VNSAARARRAAITALAAAKAAAVPAKRWRAILDKEVSSGPFPRGDDPARENLGKVSPVTIFAR